MKFKLVILLSISLLFGCQSGKSAIDEIYYNGTVYTVDANFFAAEAIAISGEKIVAIGTSNDVLKLATRNTTLIDLQGKTVVPGFTDSHYHLDGVGKREVQLNLDGTKSLADFLARVADEVKLRKQGEWIIGRGWIEEDWPNKAFPTRLDLDNVAPENPVFLKRADGHAAIINSKALKTTGISGKSDVPEGGKVLTFPGENRLTGMLIDNAIELVKKHLPPDTTEAQIEQFYLKAQQIAFAYGITQIHDMGTDWHHLEVLESLYKKGEFKLRVHAYVSGPGKAADRLLQEGAIVGEHGNRLTVRGIKAYQDGALGSRGAALLEPYCDADGNGLILTPPEQLQPLIDAATKAGLQMAIHAIGDRANRLVLDLYEQSQKNIPIDKRGNPELHHRIEHAQIVAPEDIARFSELNIVPSMQPSHAIGDLHFAVRRLCPERMTRGYAWRTFIESGSIIPAGSDAPVEEGNPMIEFYAASVRKDTTGFSNADWHEELKMTREQALKALTIWPAKVVLEDKIRGSLEVGKLADFVVLEHDPLQAAPDQLFNIKVEKTVIGGEVVYQRMK